MSYVDLDPLSAFATVPSDWLAQLLANTEALHDGTGFPDGVVPANSLLVGGSSFYYNKVTLSSAGDSLSLTSIPNRKYIRIIASLIPSGTIRAIVRFNNDSGSNYAYRASTNGGADGTAPSVSAIIAGAAEASEQLIIMDIVNISGQEKLVQAKFTSYGTAGAGNTPSRIETDGKWTNTSGPISRIDVINDQSGDYASGSEIIILAHN